MVRREPSVARGPSGHAVDAGHTRAVMPSMTAVAHEPACSARTVAQSTANGAVLARARGAAGPGTRLDAGCRRELGPRDASAFRAERERGRRGGWARAKRARIAHVGGRGARGR